MSTYAKSYSIRLRKIVPYDGGELMARVMEVEARVVGRGRGERERERWRKRERKRKREGREGERTSSAMGLDSKSRERHP